MPAPSPDGRDRQISFGYLSGGEPFRCPASGRYFDDVGVDDSFQCLAGGRSFDDPGRYQGIDSSQYSFSLDLLGSLYGFGCFCLGLLYLALSCPAHRFNLGESGVFLRQRFGFHLFGM